MLVYNALISLVDEPDLVEDPLNDGRAINPRSLAGILEDIIMLLTRYWIGIHALKTKLERASKALTRFCKSCLPSSVSASSILYVFSTIARALAFSSPLT